VSRITTAAKVLRRISSKLHPLSTETTHPVAVQSDPEPPRKSPSFDADHPPGDFSVLNDELLNWMKFVNAGMLDTGNIVAMDYALARMPRGAAMIEIGSFCGLSTNVLTHLRRRYSLTCPFFTCDSWKFEGADSPHTPMGDGGLTFGEYRRLVRDSFIRNTRAFSRHDLPQTIELSSDDFFAAWDKCALLEDVYGRPSNVGGLIAFCYIDGDHTYPQARRDFENVDKHLKPGGFILFDDSADGSGWEVCQLVQELLQNDKYRLIGKYGNYLFQSRS